MELKIFKIDAARRQLETACKLYFNEGDAISIHTLTCAAHNVLDDIAEKRNIISLKRSVIEMIKPEYKKEFTRKLNAPANFFKHADNDPDEHIDFNPDLSEINLFDAVVIHYYLTKEWPGWLKYFYVWYVMNNPESLDNSKVPEYQSMIGNFHSLNIKNKQEFIDLCFQGEKLFLNK